MLIYYFKIFWRSLLQNKVFSFINICGLAIALACCLLIFQFVAMESSVDTFHENSGELYRITGTLSAPGPEGSGFEMNLTHMGTGFAPFFTENVPEIIQYARMMPDFFQDEGSTINYIDGNTVRTFKNIQAFYVDPEFLSMFSFPLVVGDVESVLRQPNTLLITETAAKKYFGPEDPMGKTILHNSLLGVSEYTVVGVLQDLPVNSHLQFEMLMPARDLEFLVGNLDNFMSLTTGFVEITSYVRLHPTADIEATAQKMTDALYEVAASDLEELNATVSMGLQPVTDIYFDNETSDIMIAKGNRRTIYFFGLIALITLTIALINYVNLATARAINRGKEVGIRKVTGASRSELIQQFMFEAAITNILALVIALLMASLVIPIVNANAQTQLTLEAWKNPVFLRLFSAIFILGVLLSGLGPAFILSSFKPVKILKGELTSVSSRSGLRKGLVILQFAGSIGLIICTGVFFSQLKYMENYDVGLNMDRVLILSRPSVVSGGPENLTQGPPDFMARLTDLANAETALINRISQLASVEKAAYSETYPGHGYTMVVPAGLSDADLSGAIMVSVTTLDHRFIDLYGLQVLAGEPFIEGLTPWAASLRAGITPQALINEATVHALGLETNEEAIGRTIIVEESPFQVRGVLEDFNWSSLHQAPEPMLYRYSPRNHYMSVRIVPANVSRAIAEIGAVYNELFPYDLFEYQFADEAYNIQYQNDKRSGFLFGVFAVLSIFIGCLGLFGLTAFSVTRRTKEIGIRKVAGASVARVMSLLSREFLVLVIIANIIAWPIAFYAMNNWLQNFAYKTSLSWWIFALAGMLALGIALLTVSWQSYRAASRNPVEALRYE